MGDAGGGGGDDGGGDDGGGDDAGGDDGRGDDGGGGGGGGLKKSRMLAWLRDLYWSLIMSSCKERKW